MYSLVIKDHYTDRVEVLISDDRSQLVYIREHILTLGGRVTVSTTLDGLHYEYNLSAEKYRVVGIFVLRRFDYED